MGVILLTALSAGGCASAAGKATPEPFPRPLPNSKSTAALVQGPALVSAALELRGRPYAPGAAGPDRFDCSGFVQYVFGEIGIGLPRTVTDQFETTIEVPYDQLAPGDLLFFRTSGDQPSHVAIAIGDGTFVHAPSSRGVVRVESLASSYWRERFDSVRRLP